MSPSGRRRRLRVRGRSSLAGLLLALGIFAGAAAHAAESNWSFEVLEVKRVSDNTHRVRLRPVPPGKTFPRSCAMLELYAAFDLSQWSSEGRRIVTRAGHEESLQMLAQAQATKSLVRVGSLGQGFGMTEDGPECLVASRALHILFDPGGVPVIFSVFEEPTESFEEPPQR